MNEGWGRSVIGGREPDRSGKVRDLFFLDDAMLLVTTDRISAFDRVLPTLIPGKGEILNSLSSFWFDLLSGTVKNHKITTDPNEYPPPFRDHAALLEGRSMLVRRAEVFPFECVVRGYLAGSGWSDYAATGEVSGVRLPKGLSRSARLHEPIFTPPPVLAKRKTPASRKKTGVPIGLVAGAGFEPATSRL